MRRDKGKHEKVAKCLVCGRDDGKADPCVDLQGVYRCQAPVQLLLKEVGVGTPTGGRLDQYLALQPGCDAPLCTKGQGRGSEGSSF